MKSHIKIRDKIIFVILIITILGNFIFSRPVNASTSFMEKAGGTLLEPICDLLVFLGDTVLNALQKNFYINQDVVVKANSDSERDGVSGGTILKFVGGALLIIGGVAATIASFGSFSAASIPAIAGGISAIVGAVGTTAAGTALVVWGGADTKAALSGDYDLPMIAYTPYAIFSNSIPMFDINFFSPNEVGQADINLGEGDQSTDIVGKSAAGILRPYISSGYVVLRTLAIVALLSILVYVGIRMLLSTASKDKAKYKQMLIDWLVAMCLVCIMHYIMIFIITISQNVSNMFSSMCTEIILEDLPTDTTIEVDGENQALESDSNRGNPVWLTNFVGHARLIAGGFSDYDKMMSIEYTIIYLVLVIYTLIFTVIYLKRVIYMAFLTIISPLLAMTYPLDKMHDGQAQGFNMWLKEYIFNALLQPFHLMLYTLVIGSAMELSAEHPIYALIALGFMLPAEKMLKSMFGFEKAQSPAAMGAVGLAGTGMLMSGLNKLMHGGKRHKGDEAQDKQNNIRFKPENTNALDTYVNSNTNNNANINQNNINNENQELDNTSNNEEVGTPAQRMLEADYERYNTNDYDPHETAYLENDFSERQPEYNGTEEERRQELEEIFRQQGLSDEEIAEEMKDYGFNETSDNSIEQSSEEETSSNSNSENNNIIPNKPKIKNRIGNGIMAIGAMKAHRYRNAHPLRKLRRGITYGMGAATLGMIGLAAGIASGDLGKTAQYTGAAAHIGGNVGKRIGDKAVDIGKKNIDVFKQGYYGTEYEDKQREKQIKEWQSDPNNIQYLRSRDEDYRRIMKEVYPDYARYGCYNIEDFYAAYQLEKSGRSRAQAISAYKLAKRTGDITASPDLENKWRTRLETEFGNIDDIRNTTDIQYSRIEEEFMVEQEKIEQDFERQRRLLESTMPNQELEIKRLEEELQKEQEKLETEYEEEYKEISNGTIDDEFEYKKIEELYQTSKGIDKEKYEKRYKELYEKIQNNTIDKKMKQKKLKDRYEKSQQKLKDKYGERIDKIKVSKEEQFEKINEEKNQRYKKLMEETQAKRARVKEIPLEFAEIALDDVKMFYQNKD